MFWAGRQRHSTSPSTLLARRAAAKRMWVEQGMPCRQVVSNAQYPAAYLGDMHPSPLKQYPEGPPPTPRPARCTAFLSVLHRRSPWLQVAARRMPYNCVDPCDQLMIKLRSTGLSELAESCKTRPSGPLRPISRPGVPPSGGPSGPRVRGRDGAWEHLNVLAEGSPKPPPAGSHKMVWWHALHAFVGTRITHADSCL